MTSRVLLDEGISRHVTRALIDQGYQAEHVLDLRMKQVQDPMIFLAAQQRQAVVCTANRRDFALLAIAWTTWGHGSHHGIITARRSKQPMPDEWIRDITRILASQRPLLDQIVYL
jgi:predicted nuclease of predicted toxin-antitoxin system